MLTAAPLPNRLIFPPRHSQSFTLKKIPVRHFNSSFSISDSSILLSPPSTNAYNPLGIQFMVKRSFVVTSSSSFSGSESDTAKLDQVARILEKTARYFKRLGTLGFWGQLICTLVSAVILSFCVVVTGKVTSPATFYATSGGIAAAFISVFWSFDYTIRLSERLKKTGKC